MEDRGEFRGLNELLSSVFAKSGHGPIKNVTKTSNPEKNGLDIASSRDLVSVHTQDGSTLNLFLKIKRSGGSADKFESQLQIQERETLMYSQVLPMLGKYQQENEKDAKFSLVDIFPKFYGSGSVNKDHFLIFEDILTDTDKFVTGQDEFHTEAQVITCLKHLGAFHAISFCHKRQTKISYSEKYPILQDVLFLPENKEFLKSNFDMIGIFGKHLNLLESIRIEGKKENQLLSSKIERICEEKAISRLLSVTKYLYEFFNRNIFPPKEPFAVLTHGDFHMWNIAFGSNHSVKFFDLQVSRYTSAMADVHHYLVQATTPATRARCLQTFLSAYLEGFHQSCNELGITENLPGEKDIFDEYKRLSPWGLLLGIDWILYRFITDQESFAGVEKELLVEPEKRDTERIVECLDKSGPKIWWAIQVLFDLISEMEEMGTIEMLESFHQS